MRLLSSTHASIEAGTGNQWTVRPIVIAVLLYGTLLRLASLYFLGTARFPDVGAEPVGTSSWSQLGVALTILNVALAGLLVHELVQSRRRDPSLRGAHFAGALFGLVFLGWLQSLIVRTPNLLAGMI